MKWQGIRRDSLDVGKAADEGLLLVNGRFKIDGELRRRRGMARSNIIKKGSAVKNISGFSAFQSNVMAALVDGSNLQGYQQPAALWGDNPDYNDDLYVLAQWLTGSASTASSVTDGFGSALNSTSYFPATYTANTITATPPGPLGFGYQSGKGSGGGVSDAHYTRGNTTYDTASTRMTISAYMYKPTGFLIPTLQITDATSTSPFVFGFGLRFGSASVTSGCLIASSEVSPTNVSVPSDAWFHLIVQISTVTKRMRVYINGVLSDTFTYTGSVTLPSNPSIQHLTGESGSVGFTAPFTAGYVQAMTIMAGVANDEVIADLASGATYDRSFIDGGGYLL